jgi:hypothetical protein
LAPGQAGHGDGTPAGAPFRALYEAPVVLPLVKRKAIQAEVARSQ